MSESDPLDETALDDTAAPAAADGDGPDLPEVSPQRYAIDGEVGRGGLGRIVAAHDRNLDRRVALKELLATDAASRRRFVREALITARLQHPSIVPVYDAGRWPDRAPFYAMKLVAGKPLLDAIAAAQTLDARLALVPTVLAVADAIGYAHAQHIVHRDLKPQNVLVGAFGETVVIDWGLAKDLATDDIDGAGPYHAASAGQTVAGAVMGTPAYMPPEQAAGEDVDERADVYALGGLLYHVMAGRPPHGGSSVDSMIGQSAAGTIEPLARIEPRVPPDLAAIVAKAMAHDRDARYRDAAAFADDLRRFTTGQLVGVYRYTTLERVVRWTRRHAAVVIAVAIAAVVLIAFGTWSIRRILDERAVAEQRERAAIVNANQANLAQAHAAIDRDSSEALTWLARLDPDGPGWDEARVLAARALRLPQLELEISGRPIQEAKWDELTWNTRMPNSVLRWDSTSVMRYDLVTRTSRVYPVADHLFTWLPCDDGHHAYGWSLNAGEHYAVELDLDTGAIVERPAADHHDWIGAQSCAGSVPFEQRAPESDKLLWWDAKVNAVRVLADRDVIEAAVSPDGKHALSVDRTHAVTWWEPETGQHRVVGEVPAAHLDRPDLTDDGRFAIYSGQSVTIVRDGKPPTPYRGELGTVTHDGAHVAITDRTPGRIDMLTGELEADGILDVTGTIVDLAFSEDGRELMSRGDRTYVWDVATQIRERMNTTPTRSVDFLLSDGRVGRWVADGTLEIWRVSAPHVVVQFDGMALAMSANHRWLATGSGGVMARVDATGREPVERLPPGPAVPIDVSAGAVADNGDMLVSALRAAIVWKRGAAPFTVSLPATSMPHMQWTASGVAVALYDHQLFELGPDGAKQLWPASGEATPHLLAVSGDLRHVAAADRDDTTRIIEIASGHDSTIPRSNPTALAFSHDGKVLAVGSSEGGSVIVWDIAAARGRTIALPGTNAERLVFSDDDQQLAVIGEVSLVHVDLRTGVPRTLDATGTSVREVTFDQRGSRLVGIRERDALVWDLRTGKAMPLVDAPAAAVRFDGDRLFVALRMHAMVEIADDLPSDPHALAKRLSALPHTYIGAR